jgi:hypothetical protein
MGVIDATELRAMLSVQAELRALSRRFRLGRLLVDSGLIDEPTLNRALAESGKTGRRLGEALVEAGAISSEMLQRMLARQRHLTAAALSSMLLCHPTLSSGADTARVHVVASVMAHASIESQRLPSEVVVSAEDIALGFVDVPVEIGVRSNRGLMLAFSARSRDIAGVEVTSGNTYVVQPDRGLRAQTLLFQLRLRLATGTQPGRIAFPVSVSLTPV